MNKPTYEELEAELRVTKDKLLRATHRITQLERQAIDDSWSLSNYREDERRRRDYEIGQMGGGG